MSAPTQPIGTVAVEAVAVWAPTLPSWDAVRAAFTGAGEPLATPLPRPAPQLLQAAERRRAPDSVALALEVARHAVEASGRDPQTLRSVFTSAHGDLAVNDYMCSTLAKTPTLISPTRFHNSVHNAAAGYWTIATGCMAASTALSAFDCSFAAGLLDTATQVVADDEPALLVAFDVQAVGALASVTESVGLLACALVLAPAAQARDGATPLTLALRHGPAVAPPLASDAARALAGNGMHDALPFLEWLAGPREAALALPLGASLALLVRPEVRPGDAA